VAAEGGDGALAWYGDSASGTVDLRDAIGTAGHQAVLKPPAAAVRGSWRVHP
jgi:hypothetical protein